MTTPKEEFKRLCREINSENLAIVTVFRNRSFAEDAKDAEGYTEYTERPQKIFLRHKLDYSYKDMILTLLHEYGHVLDDKKYHGCKRLKLCHKYVFDDTEYKKAQEYPKYVKFAFLHMEYIAEKYISKLLKKYKINLFTEDEINIGNMHTLMIKKYLFINGKYPPRRLKRLWLKQLKNKPKPLTLAYIRDVNKL